MARKILLLLGLFVSFYLGAHYYIRWKNTVTDDVTKIGRLVECEPNEFRSINITQKANGAVAELQFDRMDKPEAGIPAATTVSRWRWAYARPFSGEADPVLIRRIASTICELYDPLPVREADFAPSQGTAREVSRLEAVIAGPEGERRVGFDFGSMVGRNQVIRFSTSGKNRWVKIPDLFQAVASLDPKDYRNLRLMRLEADNVQQAVLTIDGQERFSLERAGTDWKVLLRGREKGVGSEEASRFVNRLATLKALGVEDPIYPAENCEKGVARAVLSVRAVAGRAEVLRFNYSKNGELSACSSLGTQRLSVHRDLLKYLDIPIGKVLAKAR